ncbi:MAG: PorT family protein [Muribaculaceae bacterium]|nr:PorT family protein [Muribaculaceae bacterium]
MKLIFRIYYIVAVCVLACASFGAHAQDNDKILNRLYADNKLIHFGFSVGTHVQDLSFTHSGYVNEAGETWFMEVPDFSPGFNVTVLADLRLAKHFNLRLSPGMYFGNKVVKFHDTTNDLRESQNVKTSFIVVPLDLKISAERHRNMRPYATVGAMATLDVAKKRSDLLKFKSSDFLLSVGIGCDFYLPFFKLCPEVKFCFGLTDVLDHKRTDLSDDPAMMKYTLSLKKCVQQMVVLSFYFE